MRLPSAGPFNSAYNVTQAYAAPYSQTFAGVPVPLVNGSHGATSGTLGVTSAGNVGPATFRILPTEALSR